MWTEWNLPSRLIWPLLLAIALIAVVLADRAAGQDGIQSGEVFVTHFSGTTTEAGRTVIDTTGAVADILDIRRPGTAPLGEHWRNEPQRTAVSAGEVGQVFGAALDDAVPPNIYLTATSAFGLHRTPDSTDWMAGMWGSDGGPGTVWKLNAANNYHPEIFAQITLEGRPNSGPALGNIAFDRWNQQLYVSDLETGMVHRLRASDGFDLGTFDHGVTGRAAFLDATNGAFHSLPPVAFDPAPAARVADCPSGDFARTPSCWNFADFRRRVWGLGVRRDPESQDVRLYYAVWSSQGFGHPDHAAAGEDEQRNALWSVGIRRDGNFDPGSVRREFVLPDFFRSPEAIARSGRSQPVSDVAFPAVGNQDVMLLAERGGVRNLGLGAENAFAFPHEARVLRYELTDQGAWRPAGRYDVGYYDRKDDGPPYIRAGAAGGVSFGMGYGESLEIDPALPDGFVWMSGDELCSPRGICFDSSAGEHTDSSDVHGIQGREQSAYEEIVPEAAFRPYPEPGPATPATGPDRSFMIDTDNNVDASGDPVEAELRRNDASRAGDVVVFVPLPAVEIAEVEAMPGEVITEEGFPEGGFPGGVIPGDYYVDEPFPEEFFPADFFPDDAVDGWDEQFDLAILKRSLAETCQEGVRCAYEITIRNNGPDNYAGPLAVSDTMPAGAAFEAASAGWTCAPTDGSVNCWPDAHIELAAFANETFEIAFTLPIPVASGEVENCVSIDWDAIGRSDGDGDANDAACVTTPVQERFDLGIDKVREFEDCAAGGSGCLYTIRVTNDGPGDFRGPLVLTETLPAGANLASVEGAWGCTQTDGEARCSRDMVELGVGEHEDLNVRIAFPVDTPDGPVENCVAIAFDEMAASDGDGDPAPDEDCATVNIHHTGFDLAIEKIGPARCDSGDRCRYTITITNNGPSEYNNILSFEDPFRVDVAEFPDAPWICAVDWVVPLMRCQTPAIILPAGASRSTEMELELPPDLPDLIGGDILENCAELDWDAMPLDRPHDTNDEDCAATNIDGSFDLAIEKTSAAECVEGALCEYEVVIVNNGPRRFNAPLSVTDTLPGGNVETVSDGWSCTPTDTADEITCESNDDVVLADGASTTLRLGVRLPDAVLADTIENCATLDLPAMGYTDDGDPANDGPVCAESSVLDADVALFGGTVCDRGSACPISVTMRNVGGRAFHGMLAIEGSLDPAIEIVSVNGPDEAWSCSVRGSGRYRCARSRPLRLEKDEEQKLSIVLQVPQDLAVEVITHRFWTVRPRGAKRDANPRNDANVSYITIRGLAPAPPPLPPSGRVPAADLAITKTAKQGRCEAGQSCGFSVLVRNAGNGAYTGPLRISDVIAPSNARLTNFGPAPWSCRGSRGRYTCSHPATTLAPGVSRSLALTFTTSRNSTGTANNCAELSWNNVTRTFAVQNALNDLGFDSGRPDGKIGPNTRKAIGNYQGTSGLRVTGEIDDALLRRLFGSWGAGDADAGNDRDCAEADLRRPAPFPAPPPPVMPPVVVPPPVVVVPRCDAGWSEVGRNRAKALVQQGWQIRQVTRGGRSILCARQPLVPAPQCEAGWSKVSRARAKILAAQGWRVRQVTSGGRTIMCARKSAATPPQCTGGRVRNNKGQCVCPSNKPVWNGRVCVARVTPPTCPSGWSKVSRARAKTLVTQGWQIKQVTKGGQSILCARKQVVVPPRCTGGRVRNNKGQCVCTAGRRWSPKLGKCVCPAGQRWSPKQGKCVLPQLKIIPQLQIPQLR